MIRIVVRVLTLMMFAVGVAACSRAADDAPAVATPTVTLSHTDAAIGSPLEMTYRFAVASNAPAFTEDYWVFVHFVDSNGELMWTDDHEPATPTTQWKPGMTVEYSRTMFVPKFPYVGQTRVEIGLFSPKTNTRLPLTGSTRGQRAYQVAAFEMKVQSDNLFVVFRDGWQETEVGPEGSGQEWQWSKKDAVLSFKNPKRDVQLYLQVDQPAAAAFPEPQHVDVRIGGASIDSFALAPGPVELRRIDVPAAQLGTGDAVEVVISTDKTFVPASIPALRSNDARELGIRVFRAFVQIR